MHIALRIEFWGYTIYSALHLNEVHPFIPPYQATVVYEVLHSAFIAVSIPPNPP